MAHESPGNRAGLPGDSPGNDGGICRRHRRPLPRRRLARETSQPAASSCFWWTRTVRSCIPAHLPTVTAPTNVSHVRRSANFAIAIATSLAPWSSGPCSLSTLSRNAWSARSLAPATPAARVGQEATRCVVLVSGQFVLGEPGGLALESRSAHNRTLDQQASLREFRDRAVQHRVPDRGILGGNSAI